MSKTNTSRSASRTSAGPCLALAVLAAVASCTHDRLSDTVSTPSVQLAPRHDGSSDSTALGPMRLLEEPLPYSTEIDPSLPVESPLNAVGSQGRAAVASGAGLYFAAWEDSREGGAAIYGARVSPETGEVFDKGGVKLTSGPAFAPRVAFDGKAFVVGWSTGVEVELVKVTPGLAPQVGVPVVLASGESLDLVGLAAGDGHVLAATSTAALNAFQFVSLTHIVNGEQSTTPLVGPSPSTPNYRVGLAYCGKSFRVAAPLGGGLSTYEYTPGPSPLTKWNITTSATNARAASVACTNADDAAILWEQGTSTTQVRIRRTGGKGDVVVVPDTASPSSTSIARYGSDYVFAWQESTGSKAVTKVARLTALGAVEGLSSNQLLYAPALATNTASKEASAVLAYQRADPSDPTTTDVYARTNLLAGLDTDVLVSSLPNSQRTPLLAWVGDAPQAVWLDEARGIDAARPQSRPLDAEAAPTGEVANLSTASDLLDTPPSHFELALAGGPNAWAAAWVTTTALLGEQLTLHRETVGTKTPAELTIGTPLDNLVARRPTLAARGSTGVLAFVSGQEVCADASGCEFVAAKLALRGFSLASPKFTFEKTVEVASTNAARPSLALREDGSGVVVWGRGDSLYRLSFPAGQWEATLQASPIPVPSTHPSEPALAFRDDEPQGLLVWRDESAAGIRIFAGLVGPEGALPDGDGGPLPLVVSGAISGRAPKVVVHDGKYLVVWEGSFAGGVPQIWGAAVRFDGSLGDEAPLLLSSPTLPPGVMPANEDHLSFATPPASTEPSLLRSPAGDLYLAYEQLVPRFAVPRVVARRLPAELAIGSACTQASECATRHCVDGTCCDSACDAACQRCVSASDLEKEGDLGTCVAVTKGGDDACAGECGLWSSETWPSDRGFCGTELGDACQDPGDCASGHCKDLSQASANGSHPDESTPVGGIPIGICCTTECNGACETCVEPSSLGVCVALQCGGYACAATEGGGKRCLDGCTDTSDCAAGFQCVAGACVTPTESSTPATSCAVGSVGHESGALRPRLVAALAALFALRRRREARRVLASRDA